MWSCWFCGHSLESAYDTSRSASCGGCGRSSRCCRNCAFYDSKAYNACSESQAERVVDKEAANFCDYFKPSLGLERGKKGDLPDPKAAAEALFKKK